MFLHNTQKGFSLIELMIVISVMGLLTRVFYVQGHMFYGQAKRTEAKSSLESIFKLQQDYYMTNSRYYQGELTSLATEATTETSCITANNLGFTLNCLQSRYAYACTTSPDGMRFVCSANEANWGSPAAPPPGPGPGPGPGPNPMPESFGLAVEGPVDDAPGPVGAAKRSVFVGCALSVPETGASTLDSWSIDEKRSVTHPPNADLCLQEPSLW